MLQRIQDWYRSVARKPVNPNAEIEAGIAYQSHLKLRLVDLIRARENLASVLADEHAGVMATSLDQTRNALREFAIRSAIGKELFLLVRTQIGTLKHERDLRVIHNPGEPCAFMPVWQYDRLPDTLLAQAYSWAISGGTASKTPDPRSVLKRFGASPAQVDSILNAASRFDDVVLDTLIEEARKALRNAKVQIPASPELTGVIDNPPREPEPADHTHKKEVTMPTADRQVFIVHGHSHALRDHIDLYLTKELGLNTIVMEAGAHGGRTLPEKFEEIAGSCAFAVFILTADDDLQDRVTGTPVKRARQNVILEVGYFWGLLGRRHRIALLVESDSGMELPSDISGIGWIAITKDLGETKRRLHSELRLAGIVR